MAWIDLDYRNQRPADPWGPIKEVVALYEKGHHAPMRMTAKGGKGAPRSVAELGSATVEGPALEREVVLGCNGPLCRSNIRHRIPFRIGEREGYLQRPRFGLSFSSRIIHIEAGDQSWAVVPRWSRMELRRDGPGGRPVAVRSVRRRDVSDEAAPEEVALALFLETQGHIWISTRILVRILFGWLQGV